MKLETENSLVPEGATEKDLVRIFGDDDELGGFVILTADDGSFLQAAGKRGSTWTLEFYPEKDAPRHQQATTQLDKGQLRAAFTDFLQGRTGWRTSFEWREQNERKGCLPGLLVVLLMVVAATIGCDQASKRLATIHLKGAPPQSFLGDSLRLQFAENSGAFLSLGSDLPEGLKTALFTFGTALIVAACVVVILHRRGGTMTALGLSLVAAGGMSNLVDRVAHGAVVDFLNVGVGPLRTGIFNVADMAIMAGVALMLLRPRGE